jgi:hypothetical protein
MRGQNPTEPASLVYRFIGLHIIWIMMSVHATATDLSVTSVLSPYAKFKMVLKSKEVKRQYMIDSFQIISKQ